MQLDDVAELNSNHLGDTGELIAGTKFGGTVYYRKRNGFVEVYMPNTYITGLTENADNLLVTIPNGYRPLKFSNIIHIYGGQGFAYVSNDGRVVIHANSGVTGGYMALHFTYIAND